MKSGVRSRRRIKVGSVRPVRKKSLILQRGVMIVLNCISKICRVIRADDFGQSNLKYTPTIDRQQNPMVGSLFFLPADCFFSARAKLSRNSETILPITLPNNISRKTNWEKLWSDSRQS